MNDLDNIFAIIGKLYVDVYNTQKIIEVIQQQIKDKDQEIARLKQSKDMNE
jgi:hypothetical protein